MRKGALTLDTQLKRGIVEVCVLAALLGKDSYGYQIVKDLAGIIDISESTLYPILKRLEASRSLEVYSVEHNGRLRKYYHITADGREKIVAFVEEWKTVMDAYEFIKGEIEDDQA